MLTAEKGGHSERFYVCLWPMFSILSAFSVKAPWRLHALPMERAGFFFFFTALLICDHSEKVIKFYFAVDGIPLSHVLLRLGWHFKVNWTKLTCSHGILQRFQ